MDPEPMSLVSQFILILVLTLLNAFFASAEMAIVSVNRNRIKMLADDGNKKASLLVDLLEEPNKFLSTIQVGITLAGFFSSASAATGISEVIGASLSQLGIPYAQSISLVVITLLLSYVTLVFGELVPKRIALQKSEQMAMLSVRPIVFVFKFAKPFVKLLSLSTNVLLRVIGMSDTDLEEKVSREEIKSLVDAGEEYGVINQIEKEMINSIFDFDDKLAKEVMTPRTEVYMINIKLPLSIEELLEENYSRIPVYEGDMDNIIGILYLKDFLHEAYQVGFENVGIKKLLHRPYFVPECKNIDQLFKELQKSKNHLAVLIDEYGGFSGIVTIEDLIEEVMGDINDEYDDDDPVIRKIDNDTYIVNGLISIKELNDKLQLNLDEETEDYDTLGGFLINQIDYIPSETEECMVEYENLVFKIECVKDKRIEMVKIHIQ
ncbi:HlyC/CorC family transporter [Turicibacter bilis]|uniref:HlyC/CorC family transporter n=1 Tax=Turicibacter bilis TaxID=2735723 RepID=A0A9Q9CRH2_9FIRM|nr:hemolysin family protein [Turicibacter bilis]MBS3196904.1 HlyC/CorC family transporter [Turicibacter bilis]MBS3199943.1 HlyC/CorC family transporter [Turicibacter bilis]UUF04881.1 HlyC/CorC family transporter [Turicibacter bilis]UUF08423.1 HlyC/CorC family transporter [Turicibacter bilis]